MAGGIVGAIAGQLAGQIVNQTISSMVSQFGMSNMLGAITNLVNQSLGNALHDAISNGPLPQFIQDAAHQVIDDILGGNQQRCSAECQQAVDNSDLRSMVDQFVEDFIQASVKEANEECQGSGKGGDNWLVMLAKAMAKMQAEHMDKMEAAQKEMGSAGDDKEAFFDASATFQAESQMFKLVSEALSTMVKSVGEGLASIARKQ
ncbi:hypothetical protein [Thiolapillus sp.]